LLELWVKGLPFDWQRLYGDATPRRISLPTYPFAKELYWIEGVQRERRPAHLGERDRPVGSVADSAVATFAVARGDSRAQVEEYVTEYFSEKLKLPRGQIKPNVGLNTYGLDSIGAMGFRQVCEAAFGIEITAREMLGCDTIAAITAHIVAKIGETEAPVEAAADVDGGVVAAEPVRP